MDEMDEETHPKNDVKMLFSILLKKKFQKHLREKKKVV
jgi:hypothetical protein